METLAPSVIVLLEAGLKDTLTAVLEEVLFFDLMDLVVCFAGGNIHVSSSYSTITTSQNDIKEMHTIQNMFQTAKGTLIGKLMLTRKGEPLTARNENEHSFWRFLPRSPNVFEWEHIADGVGNTNREVLLLDENENAFHCYERTEVKDCEITSKHNMITNVDDLQDHLPGKHYRTGTSDMGELVLEVLKIEPKTCGILDRFNSRFILNHRESNNILCSGTSANGSLIAAVSQTGLGTMLIWWKSVQKPEHYFSSSLPLPIVENGSFETKVNYQVLCLSSTRILVIRRACKDPHFCQAIIFLNDLEQGMCKHLQTLTWKITQNTVKFPKFCSASTQSKNHIKLICMFVMSKGQFAKFDIEILNVNTTLDFV